MRCWVQIDSSNAQENVLAEANMMIPDTRQRLAAALQDLSNLLVQFRCCLSRITLRISELPSRFLLRKSSGTLHCRSCPMSQCGCQLFRHLSLPAGGDAVPHI